MQLTSEERKNKDDKLNRQGKFCFVSFVLKIVTCTCLWTEGKDSVEVDIYSCIHLSIP